MDPYVTLAKRAITHYLTTGTPLTVTVGIPARLLKERAGVFVSLHRKDNHALRGCIGTFLPTQPNIAAEIIANAVAASIHDPRFEPVSATEVDTLAINVDVLSVPEQVNNIQSLDPKKYGLIVKNQHGRTGLLLPDIGVESINEQIAICCQKGGIDPAQDELSLARFTVERHT